MLLTTKSLEAGTRGKLCFDDKNLKKLGEQRQRESERKNNDYHHTAQNLLSCGVIMSQGVAGIAVLVQDV